MSAGEQATFTTANIKMTQEQYANATTIVNVGLQQYGMSKYGLIIGVATAIQESRLINLSGGDRDSEGLFQQRPSQGWGTPAQVTDPQYAAGKFFAALQRVPNWQNMPLTQAAQAVQRSGFPDAYAKWEAAASDIVSSITGSQGSTVGSDSASPLCGSGAVANCPATDATSESGLTADALLVLRCGRQQFPDATNVTGLVSTDSLSSDSGSGRQVSFFLPADYKSSSAQQWGKSVADWMTAHAAELGIKYVAYQGKWWYPSSGSWSTYSPPGADKTSDNALAFNRVQVNVFGNSGTGLASTITSAPTGNINGWAPPLPAGSYTITSPFGWRIHPVLRVWKLHAGVDLATKTGSPIYSVTGGTVVSTSYNSSSGNITVVQTPDPAVQILYMHQSGFLVKAGDVITPGQSIGLVGATGYATGPHLHLQIQVNGQPIDPVPYLANVGLFL